MQPTFLRELAELVYQYGPFGFSIIFLYSISRWAYKKYEDASKASPPASAAQISATRWIYIVSFTAGICLVAVSVGWWFIHHPLYVVRGKIRGLDHNIRISSDELYFLDRPHPSVTANDIPLHDEDFVAISDQPFKKGHLFPLDFGKNDATHDQLEIEYDPNDSDNVFTSQFKDGKNILVRSSLRAGSSPISPAFRWLTPDVVYAQTAVPAAQPTYQLSKPPLMSNSSPLHKLGAKVNPIQQAPELDSSIVDTEGPKGQRRNKDFGAPKAGGSRLSDAYALSGRPCGRHALCCNPGGPHAAL